jgi:hypothetical protein
MPLTEKTSAIAKIDPESKLTIAQLCGGLPSRMRKYVTQDMVDVVNDTEDGDFREHYRNNVLSFTTVLQEGKYKTLDYINAVKFVSFKLLGDGNTLAYSKTFPERYQRLVDKGITGKNIAAYSTAYNRGDLVNKIMEQSLVPVHILNMDIHQEAINTQAELMRSAKSETVRQKAAECLIVQLKAPESAKIEIDVNYSSDIVDDLRATTKALAQQQLKMIKAGHMSAQEVAHSDIIAKRVKSVETEYEEVK